MNADHQILFEPFKIRGTELKNRFIMAAMGTGGMVTSENAFNQQAIEYYVARAKGGVGLIITGTVYAENDIERVVSGVMPCPATNVVAFMNTAAVLVERVHAYGTKIFVQLTAGFGRVIQPGILIGQPVSASPVKCFWNETLMCRALTKREIQSIVEKTGKSAAICKEAGFDGIEIHAVHEGYLLDQFAIKYFNKRTDEYGGNLRNRLKFACDIVKEIKKRCGKEFPVIMRYSLKSCIKGTRQGGLPGEAYQELGRDIEEGIEAARILEEAGYDGFDVDAGTYDSWYWSHPPMYFGRGIYLPYAETLKKHLKTPVFAAGRMDDPDLGGKSILEGKIDAVALGRPLLADPELPKKIQKGKRERIRPCLSCHEGCMNRLVKNRPISCTINPATGREETYGLLPAWRKKNILVIGGGVAGMEFARIATTRGHHVTLHEKSGRLGGLLIPAGGFVFKEDTRQLLLWYETELNRLGLRIHLNSEIQAKDLTHTEADTVVLATGSLPNRLALPGGKLVLQAEEILRNKTRLGDQILIVGGGLIGCELALDLSLKGKTIYLVEILGNILSSGPTVPYMNRTMLSDLLKLRRVSIFTNARVIGTSERGVTIKTGGEDKFLEVNDVISAVGYHPNNGLAEILRYGKKEYHIIGDAAGVRNIMSAVWSAYEIARGE